MKPIDQPCGPRTPLDPVKAAFFWRSKADTLLKVEVEWQTLDGKTADEDSEDQLENFSVPGYYSDYSTKSLDWLEGLRYFTGGENQQATFNRTKINLKVSIPGLANQTVKLKAFDVDDTTPSEWNTNGEIDDSDTAGDDNNLDWVPDIFAGKFISTESNTATATLDAQGEAIVEFRTSAHPGSNYRVAVTLDQFSTELDALQVSDSSQGSYVTADDEQVSGFPGAVSPLLTTWRKLHVESDSMEAIPTDASADEKNYESGTVTSFSRNSAGMLVIGLSDSLTDTDRYIESGSRLVIDGVLESILIASASGSEIVIVYGGETPTSTGQTYRIYDDDFEIEPLPLDTWSGSIINQIKVYYAPAFIEVVEALNPNTTIPFKLNEGASSITGGFDVWDESKDGDTSSYYWHQLLAIGFQPQKSADADGEIELLVGGTPERGIGRGDYSIVYVESVRESDALSGTRDPNKDQLLREWLSIIGAHEIGHVPGSASGEGDHSEGGLMGEGLPSSLQEGFSDKSLRRFRSTSDWDSTSLL